MIQYEKENLASVRKALIIIKAEHIAYRIIKIAGEFYQGPGVEPTEEIGLMEDMVHDLSVALSAGYRMNPMLILDEYYRGSGVEPIEENDLADLVEREMDLALDEMTRCV